MSEARETAVLLEYVHPFRWLYSGFWLLMAVLAIYFIVTRPDGIVWMLLLGSVVGLLVTFFSRQRVSVAEKQLTITYLPPLWRPVRRWPLADIADVMQESTLSLGDRETTRPLHYTVLIHEKSGRFLPLIVVHRAEVAQTLIEQINQLRGHASAAAGPGNQQNEENQEQHDA